MNFWSRSCNVQGESEDISCIIWANFSNKISNFLNLSIMAPISSIICECERCTHICRIHPASSNKILNYHENFSGQRYELKSIVATELQI